MLNSWQFIGAIHFKVIKCIHADQLASCFAEIIVHEINCPVALSAMRANILVYREYII